MKKDKTVIKIIEQLKLLIDFASIEVVDYWEADLCATGLKKGNKLVYISTFNQVENKAVVYDFDLELLDEKDKMNVVKALRNSSQEELIKEVKQFLEI